MKYINIIFIAAIISSVNVFAEDTVINNEEKDNTDTIVETAQFTGEYFEKWKTAPLADLLKEINAIFESSRANDDKINSMTMLFRGIWLDPTYTSEEVEKLRKDVELAEAQLSKAQIALRDAVMELPEIKAKVQEMEDLKNGASKYAEAYNALRKIYHDRRTTIVPDKPEQKTE